MNITIDITPSTEDGVEGFLYSLYLEPDEQNLVLVGSGHETTLRGVFHSLESLIERTI